MVSRSILISTIPVLLLLLALEPAGSAVKAASGNETQTVLYTVTNHYEPLAWMRGADRFSSGATIFVHDSLGKHPLVPNFAASADSAVSFDGQRVLFAGKLKAGDPWQIWEVPLAGGEPRRISSSSDDDVRPFYLPEDRVVYARRSGGRYALETIDLAGGKPLPLTYGPANFLPADVLRDGRILFESAYPLGAETASEIFTVYSDGSGVESYRCDHGHRVTPRGRQVQATSFLRQDTVLQDSLRLALRKCTFPHRPVNTRAKSSRPRRETGSCRGAPMRTGASN